MRATTDMDAEPVRLLVTGAAGLIGQMLRPRLRRPGRVLQLLDVVAVPPGGVSEAVETVTASVTDLEAMTTAMRGVEAVVHLGAISAEAPWQDILHVNVHGTYCVLEAARLAGLRRVILASSNHAVGFYAREDAGGEELPADVSARPDTYYGWSKAAIESLGRLYADRFAMDVLCLRIGTCSQQPTDARSLATWLSPDDAARLVEACLSAQRPGFRTVWGISRNTRRWWSLAAGEALGYDPVDDAEAWASTIDHSHHDHQAHQLVGGPFCSAPLGIPM